MNMTLISVPPESTVGGLFRAVPARARTFEHLGIDFCCGGKKSLAEVCRVMVFHSYRGWPGVAMFPLLN